MSENANFQTWLPEDLQPIPKHDPIRRWIDPRLGTWASSCGCGFDGHTHIQCMDKFLE